MKAVSQVEHQEYWIRTFYHRLFHTRMSDTEQQITYELLSAAIKEWRRHKTLTLVK